MGGINHQPCRHYLDNSTKTSRSLSLARANFEHANIALEDVLLKELAGGIGSVEPILSNLSSSVQAIEDMEGHLSALSAQMQQASYTDLSPAHTIDFDVLGTSFVGAGIVDVAAWETVNELSQVGGFSSVLASFKTDAAALKEQTRNLMERVKSVAGFADTGTLHKVLEENLTGNFKQEFARLYCSWAVFQQKFLASSMRSTQIWYSFMGYGPLVGNGTPVPFRATTDSVVR